MTKDWTLEDQVDDYLKTKLNAIKVPYTVESNMSVYMKQSLKGGAKTQTKTNFGKPDFEIETYVNQFKIPVIFENKLHVNKLKNVNKSGLKSDDKSISNYAVNGAIYYAQTMIDSGYYPDGVIAIGLAGDNPDNVSMEVYYVYASQADPKYMSSYKNVDFLESAQSYHDFLANAKLTESEKHDILIKTTTELSKQAKKLNNLMNDLSIKVDTRVIYVSGCLLAMQDIDGINNPGLTPKDLVGSQLSGDKDGDRIVRRIQQFLNYRHIPQVKVDLMMSYFNSIQTDSDRDLPSDIRKPVEKLFSAPVSTNKQVFSFIYEYVFKSIDGGSGHLDIMGSMYSEFLKYALGDGKALGIVLTPVYVTKLMTKLINVNKNSNVMDLATGSAGFLIASMEQMINDANETYGRYTTEAKKQIQHIKQHQMLGVELDSQMYTLATTNMILRGDGSSQIKKGNSFTMPEDMYKQFEPNRFLLNPPFNYAENGMPFLVHGLKFMHAGGYAAIIVQDSAGSGKAVKSNQQILKNNTLVASIKMPIDLFQPSAGVQTSIYIFETGKPHDFDQTVRFIDFRNDGYKRTGRGLHEIDHPTQRYQDILKIFKAGRNAKLGSDSDLWDLDNVVFDDQINNSGADWNFENHQIIDTTPVESDFRKTVGDYLSWKISQIIKEDQ